MSYANSADANQTPHSATTTLSLHCFDVCLLFYRTLGINGLTFLAGRWTYNSLFKI